MAGYYRAVERALYTATREVLDELGYPTVKIVIGRDDVLEPVNTYCVLDVLHILQKGKKSEATFLKSPTEEVLESMSHYSVCAQYSFVGNDAMDSGPDFHHNISNNRKCSELLNMNNFGLLTSTMLRRIPQKRESEWVDAFNMDLDLSFAIQTRQTYDWVEFITVNGESIRIWKDA